MGFFIACKRSRALKTLVLDILGALSSRDIGGGRETSWIVRSHCLRLFLIPLREWKLYISLGLGGTRALLRVELSWDNGFWASATL